MKWWEDRLIGFDVETTGTDQYEDRIVSAAVPYVGGGRDTEPWSIVVNPGVEIPEEAAKVHGITTERARKEGVPADEAIPMILERLAVTVEPAWATVMFNAQFDATIMHAELLRHGAPGLAVLDLRIVDPRVIDRHVEKYRSGKRQLTHACAYYRVNLEGAHDADFDAIAACRLAYRLGKDGRVVRRTRDDRERQEFIELTQEWERVRGDLELLHFAQRQWCWSQAKELEEYFHRGNPAKDVPPQPWRRVPREWPITERPDPIDVAAARAAEAAARADDVRQLFVPGQSEAELTTPEWTG